jgi:hypothetical protein
VGPGGVVLFGVRDAGLHDGVGIVVIVEAVPEVDAAPPLLAVGEFLQPPVVGFRGLFLVVVETVAVDAIGGRSVASPLTGTGVMPEKGAAAPAEMEDIFVGFRGTILHTGGHRIGLRVVAQYTGC